MTKYDFRTTHYMVEHHFDQHYDGQWFIEQHKKYAHTGSFEVESVKFFPGDIIIINVRGNIDYRFDPAEMCLLKYLWDTASPTGRRVIKKHIARCHFPRKQYAMGVEADMAAWWMSVWLGSIEDTA
jgi:hypothetical protein